MRAPCGAGLVALAILLLATPGAQAATGCAKPSSPLSAVAATHTMPPYPAVSEMTDEHGVTMLKVTIGVDGKVTDATVVKSSGSLRLDETTLDFVKSNWRWNPPIVDCRPIAVQTEVAVNWKLRDQPTPQSAAVVMVKPPAQFYPPEALAQHQQGSTAVVVTISATGKIVSIQKVKSSGFDSLDLETLALVTVSKWIPAQMNNSPVPAMFVVVYDWVLPGTPSDPVPPPPPAH